MIMKKYVLLLAFILVGLLLMSLTLSRDNQHLKSKIRRLQSSSPVILLQDTTSTSSSTSSSAAASASKTSMNSIFNGVNRNQALTMPFFINSGSKGTFIDAKTQDEWKNDQYCVSGLDHNICAQVPDISNLYCTGRNGFVIQYNIPGMMIGYTYNITLHFMETYWEKPNKRMANIYMDDILIKPALDYYVEFGYRTPGTYTSTVDMKDNMLSIKINSFNHRTITSIFERVYLFFFERKKVETATTTPTLNGIEINLIGLTPTKNTNVPTPTMTTDNNPPDITPPSINTNVPTTTAPTTTAPVIAPTTTAPVTAPTMTAPVTSTVPIVTPPQIRI